MEAERFEQFSSLISGIYRDIQKLKAKWTEPLGMKAVHIFWVYLLKNHPEGLTASELSRHSQSNRSLVSREIEALKKGGYITSEPGTGKRNYNARISLTDKGVELAERIVGYAKYVQSRVDCGISKEELDSFYETLTKLSDNFTVLSREFSINEKE